MEEEPERIEQPSEDVEAPSGEEGEEKPRGGLPCIGSTLPLILVAGMWMRKHGSKRNLARSAFLRSTKRRVREI